MSCWYFLSFRHFSAWWLFHIIFYSSLSSLVLLLLLFCRQQHFFMLLFMFQKKFLCTSYRFLFISVFVKVCMICALLMPFFSLVLLLIDFIQTGFNLFFYIYFLSLRLRLFGKYVNYELYCRISFFSAYFVVVVLVAYFNPIIFSVCVLYSFFCVVLKKWFLNNFLLFYFPKKFNGLQCTEICFFLIQYECSFCIEQEKATTTRSFMCVTGYKWKW